MNTRTPKRIAVVSLWAENLPETVHFYRDVLGLSLAPHHGSARPHFDVGGVILTVIPGPQVFFQACPVNPSGAAFAQDPPFTMQSKNFVLVHPDLPVNGHRPNKLV